MSKALLYTRGRPRCQLQLVEPRLERFGRLFARGSNAPVADAAMASSAHWRRTGASFARQAQ